MKILLTGTFGSLNRGDESRVKSTMEALEKTLPDVHLAFLSYNFDVDSNTYRNYDLKIVKAPWQKVNSKIITLLDIGVKCLLVASGAILCRVSNKSFGMRSIKELQQYDVFIDLSGESLSDYFGQINLFFCLYQIILGIILKKKVVIYAQSIGPFDNRFGRLVARFILNRVNLITVRDEKSFEYLQKYNINKPPIYLTADPAFLLNPAPSERLNEILKAEGVDKNNKLLVGISISRGSFKRGISSAGSLEEKYRKYMKVMSRTVDHLVEELDAEVIFIPHVIISTEDDRVVYREIYQSVKNKHKFKLLIGDYTCEELKGIIGKCDLFIGSRMHANIAALSMFVPTIAIAYSHKMPSLMKMLGQEKYVCDVMSITFDELVLKIEDVLAHGERIKTELKPKIKKMKKNALVNAELVRELVYDERQ